MPKSDRLKIVNSYSSMLDPDSNDQSSNDIIEKDRKRLKSLLLGKK